MRVAQYIKRKLSRYDRWCQLARTAQFKGDWAAAVALLRRAERVRPSPALAVQLGHALKESGDAGGAVAAYRSAAAALPHDLDVREHLAFLLRSDGQVIAAAEVYAEMLTIAPRCHEAQRALAELGQRRLLPAAVMSRRLAGERADRLVASIGEFERSWSDVLPTAAFSPLHYDLFRSVHPTPPPPPDLAGGPDPAVLVLCGEAIAADVRATVDSIVRQSDRSIRILLLGKMDAKGLERIMALPCARMIERVGGWRAALAALDPDRPLVLTRAGVVLDPQAMAWLGFVARRSQADAVFGDHDVRIDSVPYGGWLTAPCLFGARDETAAAAPGGPLLAWLGAQAVPRLAGPGDRSTAGAVRSILARLPRVTHVPRVLATFDGRSLASLAAERERWPAAPDSEPAVAAAPIPRAAGDGRRATIAVIIPTRDQAEMLHRCIASLTRSSACPERVRFVVVDNFSTEPATRDRLRQLRAEGVDVVVHDRPFNWSTINNESAAASCEDILVFANNDIEAQASAQGWDDIVEDALARPSVGAVGARLVYPDGSYQHAGVTFGVAERALSAHEGIGADASAAGPGGRWITRRAVAAATGAFLATRRTVFEAVGGFDERLAVAYNDLDFCFRIRAAGLLIVYEPALTLLHYESKTRGHNVRAPDVEWDLREQAIFVETWGEATGWDPGYNPQWALGGLPFDGYREPSPTEVLRHVDCQAGGTPWLIAPRDDQRPSRPRR